MIISPSLALMAAFSSKVQMSPTLKKKGWHLSSEMTPQDQAVVAALRQVVTARSMAEHRQAFAAALAPDIQWDAPPVLLNGREAMRVMVYAAKSIAALDFDVIMAKKERVSSDYEKLHLEVLFHVMPLQPLSWAIPADLPIRATVVVGMKKSAQATGNMPGLIDLLWGRWHNLPLLPSLVRRFTGLMMGHGLRITESLWSRGLPLIGDTSLVVE